MAATTQPQLDRTITIDLLGWLADPSAQRGVRFADDGEGWTSYSYATLAERVHGARAQIDEHRRAGDGPVALILPTGPEFIAAFFGVLAAGLTPCPLAPPTILDTPEAYVAHLSALLRIADPALVLTSAEFRPLVARAIHAAGRRSSRCILDPAGAQPQPLATPAELALLQLTSGSTGTPRAVRVTWTNLAANMSMARCWLNLDHRDTFASWLPLYHDMGLIGCLLTPVTLGTDLWSMRPEQFIRNPTRWLTCFGRHGVSIGCAPTFGFAYARRKVRAEQLEGMDFSRWRGAVIAAERVDAGVMRGFLDWLAPWGLPRTLFVPAYGLAESTLAVTGHAIEQVPSAIRLDWGALGFGARARILDRAAANEPRVKDAGGWVVSSGRPLDGVGIDIVAEDGTALADGRLGEIVVSSPSNAAGYLADSQTRDVRRFVGDRLYTGDAALRVDGELYVLGRIGDSLKVRGRTVYVEDLEARLTQIPGIGRGRCVVFAGRLAEGDAVIALMELEPGPWAEAAYRLLTGELGEGVHVRVFAASPGTIARTSSGKPRRRLMWQALLEGRLGATPVAGSAALGQEAA